MAQTKNGTFYSLFLHLFGFFVVGFVWLLWFFSQYAVLIVFDIYYYYYYYLYYFLFFCCNLLIFFSLSGLFPFCNVLDFFVFLVLLTLTVSF